MVDFCCFIFLDLGDYFLFVEFSTKAIFLAYLDLDEAYSILILEWKGQVKSTLLGFCDWFTDGHFNQDEPIPQAQNVSLKVEERVNFFCAGWEPGGK